MISDQEYFQSHFTLIITPATIFLLFSISFPVEMTNDKSERVWARLLFFIHPFQAIDIKTDTFTVGRDPSCDLIIPATYEKASKRHFSISKLGEIAILTDSSSNGTLVNSKLLQHKRMGIGHATEIEIKWDMYFVFFLLGEQVPKEKILLDRYFLFEKELGRGSFATVRLAIDIESCTQFACKQINTKPLKMTKFDTDSCILDIRKEIDLLGRIDHPNIVSIRDVYHDSDQDMMYILLERVGGGDLYDCIVKRQGFPEHEAMFVFYQLLQAVKYMHDLDICHRDIKAENILVDSFKPFARVIIADFGMSKQLGKECQIMQTRCGTLTYLAPEMIDSPTGYSKQVDCWALGVVLYSMVSATLPFGNVTSKGIIDRIKRAEYAMPEHCTDRLQDLISKLLDVDPRARYSVNDCLGHEWITNSMDILERLYTKVFQVTRCF
jgi:hypothetical protein